MYADSISSLTGATYWKEFLRMSGDIKLLSWTKNSQPCDFAKIHLFRAARKAACSSWPK